MIQVYFHHLNPFDPVAAIPDKYRFAGKYRVLPALFKGYPHREGQVPNQNSGK